MKRHSIIGLLSFILVLVAAVLCCQCYADEWRNWTAPGWGAVSCAALGPDGAFWLHGGTSEMSGLLKATVRDGLVSFRHLSPYNSLCIPGTIYDMHCDLNGLWLATDQGLVDYEGIYSVFYTPDNSPLPVKKVVHLCAGPEGSLWVATDESLHLLNDGLWVDFTTTSTIIPDVLDRYINSLAFDQQRGILAYNLAELAGQLTGAEQYDSLYVLDLRAARWTRISLDGLDFFNDKTAFDMAFDADGVLWLALSSGVVSFDGAHWTYYSSSNSGLPGAGWLNRLAFSHEGELYALAKGPSGGVCKLVGGEWVMLPVHAPYYDTYFYNMLFDSEDALWVFTNYGYIRVDSHSGSSTLYSLPTNSMSDSGAHLKIVPSHTSDAVWLMADDAGLCRFKDGAWQSWTPENSGLGSNDVRDIAEARDGALWVLSSSTSSRYDQPEPEQLTLQRFDGTSWTNFSNGVSYFAPRITNNSPGHVLVDPSNNVWVGVNGFVLKFDGEYWEKIQLPGDFQTVFSMAFDEQTGKLAVGTAGSVLVLGENGWSAASLNPHDHVVSLAYDHDGVLWGVTTTAPSPQPRNAFSYDGALLSIYNSESTGVTMDYTYCVAVDADNVKWFGRYAHGVKTGGAVSFDGSTWREHTSENSGVMQTFDGKNAPVCSIAFAPNGDAWFGSAYYGVSRLSNRGQPDPSPTVQVFLDKPAYAPGDVMSASLIESNLGSSRWEVNVMIAIMPPDGSLFFFPNWTTSISIFMSQLLLPGTLTQPMEFFQLPISESLPKGQYTWFAALGHETGLISGISSASFTVN